MTIHIQEETCKIDTKQYMSYILYKPVHAGNPIDFENLTKI